MLSQRHLSLMHPQDQGDLTSTWRRRLNVNVGEGRGFLQADMVLRRALRFSHDAFYMRQRVGQNEILAAPTPDWLSSGALPGLPGGSSCEGLLAKGA